MQPQRTFEYPTSTPAHHPSAPGKLAERLLRGNAYLALQHISCDFHAGVLTLRGRLPTYYLKQVALTAVAVVEGVERIDDQIEVTRPAEPRRDRHDAYNC
jgi:osmotically-inducible protein OsmY